MQIKRRSAAELAGQLLAIHVADARIAASTADISES
jgi:hypothetical protein